MNSVSTYVPLMGEITGNNVGSHSNSTQHLKVIGCQDVAVEWLSVWLVAFKMSLWSVVSDDWAQSQGVSFHMTSVILALN